MSSSNSLGSQPEPSTCFISLMQVSSRDLSRSPTFSQFLDLWYLCKRVEFNSLFVFLSKAVKGEIFASAVNTNGLNTDSLGLGVAVNQWQFIPDFRVETWLDLDDAFELDRKVLNICSRVNFDSEEGAFSAQSDVATEPKQSWKLKAPVPSQRPNSCAFWWMFSEDRSTLVVTLIPCGLFIYPPERRITLNTFPINFISPYSKPARQPTFCRRCLKAKLPGYHKLSNIFD